MTANGPGVSFEDEENVLGLDSSDSSTASEYTKKQLNWIFLKSEFYM